MRVLAPLFCWCLLCLAISKDHPFVCHSSGTRQIRTLSVVWVCRASSTWTCVCCDFSAYCLFAATSWARRSISLTQPRCSSSCCCCSALVQPRRPPLLEAHRIPDILETLFTVPGRERRDCTALCDFGHLVEVKGRGLCPMLGTWPFSRPRRQWLKAARGSWGLGHSDAAGWAACWQPRPCLRRRP